MGEDMRDPEPLRYRLRRFLALLGLILAIIAVVLVVSRLSQDTLALLLGLFCGVGVMLPLVLFLFWHWRRQEKMHFRERSREADARPPVVVVMPPVPSGYAAQRPELWASPSPEREFTIVGSEE